MGARGICFALRRLSYWDTILSVSPCAVLLPADPLCATALPAKAWLQMAVQLSLNPSDNGEKEGALFPFQPSSGLVMVCAAAYLRASQQNVPALLPVPLVCNGFLNLQSPSDGLCWSFGSHGSEIRPLAWLPCRQCTNLRHLGRAPRREVEARPCGTLSAAAVPPGPRPLRCHLKQQGELPSLCLPGASPSALLLQLGCKGPPRASGTGTDLLPWLSAAFKGDARHSWLTWLHTEVLPQVIRGVVQCPA